MSSPELNSVLHDLIPGINNDISISYNSSVQILGPKRKMRIYLVVLLQFIKSTTSSATNGY